MKLVFKVKGSILLLDLVWNMSFCPALMVSLISPNCFQRDMISIGNSVSLHRIDLHKWKQFCIIVFSTVYSVYKNFTISLWTGWFLEYVIIGSCIYLYERKTSAQVYFKLHHQQRNPRYGMTWLIWTWKRYIVVF